MFSCEFCEISKNTFSTEHLRWLLLFCKYFANYVNNIHLNYVLSWEAQHLNRITKYNKYQINKYRKNVLLKNSDNKMLSLPMTIRCQCWW